MRRPTPRRWLDNPWPHVPIDPDAPTNLGCLRSMCAMLLAAALLVFAVWFLMRGAHGQGVAPLDPDAPHELRVEKARVIVRELYPESGMYAWLGTLITEHEKYGDPTFSGAWYWSLVYGGANFGLKVGATAPGYCSGPLDVKSEVWRNGRVDHAASRAMHQRMRTDTRAHIHHHVAEMWRGYVAGYRGRRLCEYVMMPSRPHDWGGWKFREADARHRKAIAEAREEGAE